MTGEPSTGSLASAELLDGRYRLGPLLGEGAMAQVYRAIDVQLGRTVAVKIFRPGTEGPTDDARRESEKRLLAALNHPSLVTLFDADTTDRGLAYLVMENIEGGTLESRLRDGPVSPADATSVAADLGEALQVVHGAGVIHRDIKPSNILLRTPLTARHSFRPVLADFGIAHLIDTTRVTAPGMAVGTVAYIAPEQVRGFEPTPASDVYALGLVLIEMLTGRRAFAQQTPQEAIAARLSIQPDVPADFGYEWRSLLTAMTSLDPSSRPSAFEVATRGRELDAVPGGHDPAVTAAAIVEEAPAPPPTVHHTENVGAVVSALDPTAVLPTAEAASRAGTVAPGQRGGRPVRRRGSIAALVAGFAGIAALVIALTVWGVNTADPSSPPAQPQTPVPSMSAEPLPEPVIEPADDLDPSPNPAPIDQVPSDDADTDDETGDGDGEGNSGNGNSGNGNNGNGNSGNGNGNGNNGNGNGGNGDDG